MQKEDYLHFSTYRGIRIGGIMQIGETYKPKGAVSDLCYTIIDIDNHKIITKPSIQHRQLSDKVTFEYLTDGRWRNPLGGAVEMEKL